MSRLLFLAVILAVAPAAEAGLLVDYLGQVPLPTDGVLFTADAQLEAPIGAGDGRIAMSVGRGLSNPEDTNDLPFAGSPVLPFTLFYGESDRLGGGAVNLRIGARSASFVIRPQAGGVRSLLLNPVAEQINTIMSFSDLRLNGEPVVSFLAARSGTSAGVLRLSGDGLGTRFELTGDVQFRYFGDLPTGGDLAFQVVALGVPEPTAAAMALLAIAGCGVRRRVE